MMICKNSFIPFFFGLVFCAACGSSTETEESATAAPEAGCANAVEVPVAESLDTLNIIIETSGSMKGFMPTKNRQTAFQEQIDDLLANAQSDKQTFKTLRLYTAQDNIRPLGSDRFQSMLRQGLAQAGASTPIPNLLRQIAGRYLGPNQLSVFISDFIYAPPRASDRDYIANDIRRALGTLEDRDMAVAVFGFQSEFEGIFYPAGSKSGDKASPIANCCETEIPYYIWIIGPEPAVRLASARLMRNGAPVQMEIGYKRSKPAYGIIPGSGRTGSWYLGSEGSKTILIDNTTELRQGEVSFSLGVNLEAVPSQFTDTEYLQENLEVRGRNGKAVVGSVVKRQNFLNDEKLNAKDRQLVECYTHIIKVDVKGMDDRNSPLSLNLSLPASDPSWAKDWSTDDDRNINEAGPRTFALSEILQGLRILYPQEREAVFTLNLSIKKAN